jgi:type IV pilus assembly protein PilW
MMTRNYHRKQQGLTLIELMISILLGLIILGGVVTIFVANLTSYRTSEDLARMQENARIAFELMAREVREAGGNACGTRLVSNVVNNASSNWWSDWGEPIIGYASDDDSAYSSFKAFGTGDAQRVDGTEAFLVRTGSLDTGVTITEHKVNSAQFKVNTNAHGLQDGEIVMVCDPETAAILQVTNVNSTNKTIVHNTGTGTPGNCSKKIGYPGSCNPLIETPKTFDEGGYIAKLSSAFWYIGNNPRGGRSLYRTSVTGNPTASTVEIAEGVYDMEVVYLEAGEDEFVGPASVSSWGNVTAVRITLDLESIEETGTDGNTLKRQLIYLIGLRNQEYLNG